MQILHDFTYIWNLKNKANNNNEKYSHRYGEQTSGHRVAVEIRRTGETDKGD